MMILALSAALVVLASHPATAHMMMSSPAPRQSVANPGAGGAIDYSYTAPLGTFPCKGYPAQAPVLTVAAGASIPVQVTGGANHGGGHCQFAISYDNDKSWVVLDTVVRSCLQAGAQSFNVPLPASAPSGKASFAWTWINAIGNREYYMGCSDIQVTGGSGPSGSLTGPALLVANIAGGPSIPEFGSPSLPDMHELFDKRPIITVTGNGGSSAAPPAPPVAAQQEVPPPAQQQQQQQQQAQPPAPPAPVASLPTSAPTPAATPDAPAHRDAPPRAPRTDNGSSRAACINGQFKCDGADAWALCTPARVWATQPVPPGTKCHEQSGAVVFELA